MNGVNVRQLGTSTPGEGQDEMLDPRPVVLWAGQNPAVVLTLHAKIDRAGDSVLQEFLPIRESVDEKLWATGGAFPVRYHSKGETHNVPSANAIVTADVDGDGLDELVVARVTGGADVIGWRKALAHHTGASNKPDVASYRPRATTVVPLAGRPVVFLLYDRLAPGKQSQKELMNVGAADPYQLLRVDAKGIARVQLGGIRQTVLAVGALSRPGSSEIDELLALSSPGGEKVSLSRHRPDGILIGEPREVYVPISGYDQLTFGFVPQSRVAIFAGEDQLYFVEAEKPVNWIRKVDLKALAGIERARYLGPADGSTQLKAIVSAESGMYAVDAEGSFYTMSGAAFVRSEKPVPFYRPKPPSPEHEVAVVPSPARGDEFLVAYSRFAGRKKLSDDEVTQAAERFLSLEDLAQLRHDAATNLEKFDIARDDFIAEERKRRRVDQKITTVEEWKRLLPDSYAATVRNHQGRLVAEMNGLLALPLGTPSMLTTNHYRDLEAYRAWLAQTAVSAEVIFEVVRRGAVARSFRVDGALGATGLSILQRDGIEWRATGSSVSVVTTLIVTDSNGEAEPHLYALHAGGN